MAEIEIGGATISGGKMLLILPLLGSIGGALWGGFELYQRLLTAEDALNNLPDTAEINQQLAVLEEQGAFIQQTQIDTKNEVDNQFKTLQALMDGLRRDVDSLRSDVDSVENFVRGIDENVSGTQRELRNDVYAMETTLNDRMREIDGELRTARDELEEKIEKILDNPLNDEG
jgi:chromosome segregation ATPase